MGWVREYLLSVTAAAILCSCIGMFFKKSAVASLFKTVCGVFLCIVVLRPFMDFNLPDPEDYLSSFTVETNAVTSDAIRYADEERCKVIKQQSETYICDKAAAMGCNITACITLSQLSPYAPEEITVTGNLSPYAKSKLSAHITSDLGIPKEDQHWNN